MSCQLAVCPLHQKMVRRHLPLPKRTHIPVKTDRKMCHRRDEDGGNGHRNYITTGGGEVWGLQEWINIPQYKSLPVAFLCSWRQTKAVTPLHMDTKLCAWSPTSLPFLWRGRGNAIPVSYPNLKLSFFQLLCIIWVPHPAQSKSPPSFQLLPCPFHPHLPLVPGKCQAAPQPPVLVS